MTFLRLLPVIFAAFVCTAGFGAVIPSLPLYLRDHYRASPVLTGFLVGIASAAALAGRLSAGQFIGRTGRRFSVVAGLACCAVAGLCYLPWGGLPGIGAGRIFHGLGEGFLLTAAVAWTVELAPEGRRSQTLGFLASGVWGGLSVGPFLGQAVGGLPKVGWLVAAMTLPAMIGVRFAPDHAGAEHQDPPPLILREAIGPGLVLGLTNVTYAVLVGFLPLLLVKRGLVAPHAFVVYGCAVLCGRTLLGSLPDRAGPWRMLSCGIVLLAIGIALVLTAGSALMVSIAAAILGLGYSFPWPSLALLVVDRVPAHHRAAGLGTLTAFFDIFVSLGAIAAGGLAALFSFNAPFLFALACVAASAILAARLHTGYSSRTNRQ